jgi:hypothetical protein
MARNSRRQEFFQGGLPVLDEGSQIICLLTYLIRYNEEINKLLKEEDIENKTVGTCQKNGR